MGSNSMASLAKTCSDYILHGIQWWREEKSVLNSVRKGTILFLEFSIPDWFLMFMGFRYHLMISEVTIDYFFFDVRSTITPLTSSHLILINDAENQFLNVRLREECRDKACWVSLCTIPLPKEHRLQEVVTWIISVWLK